MTGATRVARRYLGASESDLNVFVTVRKVLEHLVAEAATLPPRYRGKPGNWFDSPTSKVGMYITLKTFIEKGRAWGAYVIDHKAIPPGKAKAVEMAVRLFHTGRIPNDPLRWFADNQVRFDVLEMAGSWPARGVDDGIRGVGPFEVHDTIGASAADWARVEQVVGRASDVLSDTGLPGFASMAYGRLFLVGQLKRKSWAAWYQPDKDCIYLRPNIRGVTPEESARHLVHELGHRYWAKRLSDDLKKAWRSHHTAMNLDRARGRFPEVGEVLPLEVNHKQVQVKEYDGGFAVLVDAGDGEMVGKVLRSRVWDWMADHAQRSKFPSLYAATDVEEHFCEALSLRAVGALHGENRGAFDRIFG